MSTKDTLLAEINEAVAKRNNIKFEDYQKAANESFAADRDAEKGVINSTYDASKEYTQAVNEKAVTDTKAEYTNQYEKNAVQKLINEKQVAEKMANLGFTDSGLNRTQQTAVQLGYANQKGKIDLARQSALDELTLNLTSALTQIETNRSVDLLETDQKYNDKAYSAAQTNYNNDLTAINNQITSGYEQLSDIEQTEIEAAANAQKLADELNAEIAKAEIKAAADAQKAADALQTEIAKAEIEAAAEVQKAQISASASGSSSGSGNDTLLWYFTGTYDDYDNPIFRNSDGKTQAFGKGINPYTGTKHKDAKYGTFSNGYQPNNIGGNKLVAQEEYEVYVNGNKQKVWSYDNGETLWAWDGSINEYVDVTSQRDKLRK